MEAGRVIELASKWAAGRSDVCGLALVGSWAGDRARMDSDVDLVLLTEDVAAYTDDDEWLQVFGPATIIRKKQWGALAGRRLLRPTGLKVEIGIGAPSWASTTSVDKGTEQVVSDGFRVVHDPSGLLAALAVACGVARRT